MAPTAPHHCPDCDEETTHRLVARTRLHLGVKHKWRCETCDRGVVTLDGASLDATP